MLRKVCLYSEFMDRGYVLLKTRSFKAYRITVLLLDHTEGVGGVLKGLGAYGINETRSWNRGFLSESAEEAKLRESNETSPCGGGLDGISVYKRDSFPIVSKL